MANPNDPATIAKWLRRCTSGVDRCHRCPYVYGSDDEEHDCMGRLHEAAARTIERHNKLERQV